MSKTNIRTVTGDEGDEIDLPRVFNTPHRPDLIRRAVLSDESKKRQPQGVYELAGKLTAASSVRPGQGMSLIPRTHSNRTHHASRGAIVPSTRGGRVAHPPKPEKKIVENINKKEYAYALKSAVSATMDNEVIKERGHKFEDDTKFPIVVEDRIRDVKKTSEMVDIFKNLGLGDDLKRSKGKKIRAGKGKMRGRRYTRRYGPLFVVADECDGARAARNISGVDVRKVDELDVGDLAPGANPGRITIWTESALEILKEWK